MSFPGVVICSELSLHREVLSGMLMSERPRLQIHVLDPSSVAEAETLTAPRLVICNSQALLNITQPYAWILLYPDGENLALVGIGSMRRTILDASMQDLVSVIDEVWATSDIQSP